MNQIDYLDKTGSNWIKSDKVGSNWIKSDQVSSSWFKMVQICSDWFKLDQDESKNSVGPTPKFWQINQS